MLKHLALAALLMLGTATALRAEEPRKIAFVDTGNTGRSVTAEALANAIIAREGLHVTIISRAVDLDPFTLSPEANVVTLLGRRGIDVSRHVAAQVTAQDVKHADLLLTMTEGHKQRLLAAFPEAKAKVFTIAEYATGTAAEVPDAYGKPMDVYEAMVRQLDIFVPAALAKATAKP